MNEHDYETKRRPRQVKTMFAAFMAGAIAIGGLTYASDKLNLFGGVPAAVTAAASEEPAVAASLSTATGTASVADIAKQASPAVVKIETTTTVSGNSRFSRQFAGSGGSAGQQSTGTGSGFIFHSSGYILTNEHVVSGADLISVTVQGYDQPFTAKVVGSSRDMDLAVLKIEGTKAFPTLKLGNSDDTQIGDWVVAIGNPYDLDYSVTAGVLSAKEREISIDDEQGTVNYKHLFQTDTAINPGNSGGPLLNRKGEVIGMNTAVNAEAQGIGFAITSNTIHSVLQYLVNGKEIPATGNAG